MGVVHKVKRAAAAFESQMAANTPSPVASPASVSVSKYPRFGKRGAPQAFPSKLYEILEGENPDIVGWTSTGRGFEVRDHARLSSEVLGRFFKQDKFSSFQRQLNLYGFRKITKGSEAGSYQHPHFRRGERTTLLTIRRSTKASPARLVPSSPASYPPPPAVPYNSVAAERPRSATPSPPPAPVSRGVLPWPRPPAQTAPLHPDARGVSPDSARSICSGGGGGGGGPAQATTGGRVSRGGTPVDRLGDHRQQQQHAGGASWPAEAGVAGWGYARPIGSHGGGAADGGGGGRGSGGEVWASANANHVKNGGSRSANGWKEEEMRPNSAQLTGSRGTAAAAYGVKGSQWEEEASKKERDRAQGLDHQDVEVVGLLQRMAKEAQDSPSRKQAAPPARLAGGHPQETAASPAATSPHAQTHFRIPRPPPTGPEKAPQGQQSQGEQSQGQQSQGQQPRGQQPQGQRPQDQRPQDQRPQDQRPQDQQSQAQQPQGQQPQGQQVVFADRLYDILHHDRAGKKPPGYLPFGFSAEERTASLSSHPHPHHHPTLPSPFPPSVTPSRGSRGLRGDSFDAVSAVHRGGGGGGGGGGGRGEMSDYDRRALLARSRSRSAERGDGGAYIHGHHQHQQDGNEFEAGSRSTIGGSGRGVGGGGGGRGRGEGGGRGYPYAGRFGSGPSQNGSPLPRLYFDRHLNGQEHGGSGGTGRTGGGADAGDRRDPVEVPRLHRPSWQGQDGSYATATGSTLGMYQGDKGGHVGRPVVKAEAAWPPHRPFEAGRRVVN